MDNRTVVSSDDVIGVSVENPQGEGLGTIEALMLDKLSGQVNYVVLSYGGFLGMGDKLFALPWSIFSYDQKRDSFVINMSEERLKNSPGFDKNHWPDMSSREWTSSIDSYYGTRHIH